MIITTLTLKGKRSIRGFLKYCNHLVFAFSPFEIPKLAFQFSVYHLLAILKQQLKLQIFTPMLNFSCGVNVDIDSTHHLLLCEAQSVNPCTELSIHSITF